MKFFKIIIFILIFILPSNANTIYNLIKIPNLEIYKDKTSNEVKYLRALKPFQVGIRNDNVTCFNSKEKTIKENFNLIERNLNNYTSDFLKKINLKYVVLCENLSVSEISAAGVPNHKMRTLIIDLKFNIKFFERVIHHEVFHIINDSFKDIFNESAWSSFNLTDFKYAECSTCTNKLGLETYSNTKGFFSEYSQSTPSEDMAEVFSHLMIGINLNNKDPILEKKINFIKKNLLRIDPNFIL